MTPGGVRVVTGRAPLGSADDDELLADVEAGAARYVIPVARVRNSAARTPGSRMTEPLPEWRSVTQKIAVVLAELEVRLDTDRPGSTIVTTWSTTSPGSGRGLRPASPGRKRCSSRPCRTAGRNAPSSPAGESGVLCVGLRMGRARRRRLLPGAIRGPPGARSGRGSGSDGKTGGGAGCNDCGDGDDRCSGAALDAGADCRAGSGLSSSGTACSRMIGSTTRVSLLEVCSALGAVAVSRASARVPHSTGRMRRAIRRTDSRPAAPRARGRAGARGRRLPGRAGGPSRAGQDGSSGAEAWPP